MKMWEMHALIQTLRSRRRSFNCRLSLQVVPEIAAGLPQTLEGYFMQVQIPMGDGFKLLLSETIAESPKPGCVSLILDIDLSRTENIPTDEEGIWHLFESLRVQKNEVF